MSIRKLPSPASRQTIVDFNRRVHAVLGLPIDVVTLRTAQEYIYNAVIARRPCFLSTPNLNFAIACREDREFRDSVIHSDLSVADGVSLVWVAKMFGMPIRERVTGATLFEQLRRSSERVLSVYFFGGGDGVAAEAARRINAESCGIRCVGSQSPGFGSIEELSDDSMIQDINASHADFLAVALSAKKGQVWIARNRAKLRVPVVSHLGAVINFAAGCIRRAPLRMQRAGLEWLWRIKEEPVLWRRYFHDGMALLWLLATRVVPGLVYRKLRAPTGAELDNAWISLSDNAQCRSIKPCGSWSEANLARLRRTFDKAARQQVDIEIDLGETRFFDSAFVGLLMLMYSHQSQIGLGLRLRGVSPAIRRLFKIHCAEFLLDGCAPEQPRFVAPSLESNGCL